MERKIPKRVLLYQDIGFLLIIIISWMDELIGLPTMIMGTAHSHNYGEALLESIIVIVVWIPVNVMTRILLNRLFYLESLVKMCAWCRRIEYNDKWYTQEQFYKLGFNADVTHGICHECLKKQEHAAGLPDAGSATDPKN
jgi:hypothetical protein